jgi:hypothetical protein
MKIILWTIQALMCGTLLLLATGCETEDDQRSSARGNDVSSLPWNQPDPGEGARRFGGFPQSH